MNESETSIVDKLKLWLSKDNIHYLYLLLSILGSLGSLIGGYEIFVQTRKDDKTPSPQIIINIPKDSLRMEPAMNQPPAAVVIQPKDTIYIEKEVAVENKKNDKLLKEVIKKQIVEQETPDDFGFVKNDSKDRISEPKIDKIILIPCLVHGDYKVADGNIIKVRIMEDLAVDDISLKKNSSLSGVFSVKGSLVTVEFKNKDLPVTLYAMDKNKNFEFPFQEQFLDGLKLYLTNKNLNF